MTNKQRKTLAYFGLLKVTDKTILGSSIKIAINKNQSRSEFDSIIKMIQDRARDNRKMVADIVGEETLQNIEKIQLF